MSEPTIPGVAPKAECVMVKLPPNPTRRVMKLFWSSFSVVCSFVAIGVSTCNLLTLQARNNAHHEGRQAALQGLCLDANPHTADDLHVQWGLGWFAGRAEMKKP